MEFCGDDNLSQSTDNKRYQRLQKAIKFTFQLYFIAFNCIAVLLAYNWTFKLFNLVSHDFLLDVITSS